MGPVAFIRTQQLFLFLYEGWKWKWATVPITPAFPCSPPEKPSECTESATFTF